MPTHIFNLQDRSPFTRIENRTKGALLPLLTVQLLDNVTPVSLATATVAFTMKTEAGVAKVSAAAGTLTDAATGKVSYTFIAADVDTAGWYWGQFVITISGKTYKVPDSVNQFLLVKIATGYA